MKISIYALIATAFAFTPVMAEGDNAKGHTDGSIQSIDATVQHQGTDDQSIHDVADTAKTPDAAKGDAPKADTKTDDTKSADASKDAHHDDAHHGDAGHHGKKHGKRGKKHHHKHGKKHHHHDGDCDHHHHHSKNPAADEATRMAESGGK